MAKKGSNEHDSVQNNSSSRTYKKILGLNVMTGQPDNATGRVRSSSKRSTIKNSVAVSSGQAFKADFLQTPIMPTGPNIEIGSTTEFYDPYLSEEFLILPADFIGRLRFFRYYYRYDPIIGPIIDMHTELPLSKARLNYPKLNNSLLEERLRAFFDYWVEEHNFFDLLLSIAFEYWLVGDVFIWFSWDNEKKVFSDITVINPSLINITYDKTRGDRVYQLRIPASLYRSDIFGAEVSYSVFGYEQMHPYSPYGEQLTDPLPSEPGPHDFIYHLSRKRSQYELRGTSLLERVLFLLIYKDRLRKAQSRIAARNMDPTYLFIAEGANDTDLVNLLDMWDMAVAYPDVAMAVNFPVDVQVIGANDRLLDLTNEWDRVNREILLALGAPEEVLSGASSFGGQRIAVEVINTRYLLFREILQNFVGRIVFKPMAEANDFFVVDVNGNTRYIYPTLSFTRLGIRDSQDVFNNLFDLYQKGSLPLKYIYELLNIDNDEALAGIKADLFTPADPNINEVIRGAYSRVADEVSVISDMRERVIANLGLSVVRQPEEERSEQLLSALGEEAEAARVRR